MDSEVHIRTPNTSITAMAAANPASSAIIGQISSWCAI
jgi:hypothetical protein